MNLDLARVDQAAAKNSFTGAVTIDEGSARTYSRAFGFAHRGYHVANTPDTRFAIASETVHAMTRPRFDVPHERKRYGMGLWLHRTAPAAIIEGYDAGVSFRSTHIPASGTTASVLGNSSEGAWPVIGVVQDALDAALSD